jgi:hypothetical protein
LKITYKEKLVDDLLEIQFLIANTGVRAIRDVISPLSVEVPETCSLLDTAILYVSPAERIVRSQIDGRKVIFDFPLLNANEFFIVKLLLQGQAKPKDLKFTITVDDLPPILSPEL